MKSTVAPQPEIGTVIVHCVHVDLWADEERRFFYQEKGVRFTRPDGTADVTYYLACCPMCFENARGRAERVDFGAETRWTSDFQPILFDGTIIKPLVTS